MESAIFSLGRFIIKFVRLAENWRKEKVQVG